jgi:hypothetical protein
MFQHIVHMHSLIHCAASRKVAGSMPMMSLEYLIDNPSGRSVALGSTQPPKEIRGLLLEDKSGRCVGLITLPPSCADCLEICELQPPGALRACQDLCGE